MSSQSSSSPHQFDAYWRNESTGQLEGVTSEVYAQKRTAKKQAEQQAVSETARTSDHLFNPSAPKTYW